MSEDNIQMIVVPWFTKLCEALEEIGHKDLALLLHVLNYDTKKQSLCATGFANSDEIVSALTQAIATVHGTEPVRTKRKPSIT